MPISSADPGCWRAPSALMMPVNDETWLRQKRQHAVPLHIGDDVVVLRDQQPLYEGHIRWEGEWNFPRLVEEINRRVFFWPGDRSAPVKKAAENVRDFLATGDYIKIRLPFSAVRKTPGVRVEYCRCNARAPRTVNGESGSGATHLSGPRRLGGGYCSCEGGGDCRQSTPWCFLGSGPDRVRRLSRGVPNQAK